MFTSYVLNHISIDSIKNNRTFSVIEILVEQCLKCSLSLLLFSLDPGFYLLKLSIPSKLTAPIMNAIWTENAMLKYWSKIRINLNYKPVTWSFSFYFLITSLTTENQFCHIEVYTKITILLTTHIYIITFFTYF